MFPTLSHLIEGLTGLHLPIPGNTFGLFVALAFLAAYQVLKMEMTRRENAGEFRMDKVEVLVSAPVEMQEVLYTALAWGIFGWKIGYGLLNWNEFSSDAAGVLLSAKGNLLTGIAAAGIAGYLRYRDYLQTKGQEKKFEIRELGPTRHLGKILTMAFIAGIIGAKVFAFLEDLDGFAKDPLGSILSLNGLTFYGGLLTAGFVIIRYLHRNGYNILQMTDVFAPCLILAYGIGRIGCHMAGDGDWGIENLHAKPGFLAWLPDALWAYTYPHNVNHDGVLIPGCLGVYCHQLPNPVYPTPIYETFMALSIFALLWFLRTRLKTPGQITAIYLVLNGLERFSIEKIRHNTTYTIFGIHPTQAELIALGLMISGIVIGVYTLRKRKSA